MTSAISSLTSSTSTTGSTAQTDAVSLGNDMQTFLTLLLTQLQNQDPTSPMDVNQFTQQLVQFSQIEQQIKQNDKLDSILSMLSSQQSSDALQYIGQEVQAVGDTNYLEDGKASWSYGVPDGASSVTLNVYDSEDNLVYTQQGDTSDGRHDFDWNGVTKNGQQMEDGGEYRLEVVAKDSSGKTLDADVLVRGVVTAVETYDGQPYLIVGQLGIKPSEVVLARDPVEPEQEEALAA